MTNAALHDRDLVIFDIDGTVHDTFAWWTPVIRRGIAAFAAQEGLDLDEPSVELAESVVGMKDAGVWGPFLPPDQQHRWADLRGTVVPMECDELRSGRDYLFPGIRDLLPHLRANGVGVAVASNCRSQYFEAVLDGQGLRAISDWHFCLDSPGVTDKADMLRLAVAAAGAERPVMVGDREPDRDAAVANDMPFVWRVNSRCRIDDAAFLWDGDIGGFATALGLPGIS